MLLYTFMVLLAAFVVITGHMATHFIMFVDPWQRLRDSGYFKSWLKDTEYGFYHTSCLDRRANDDLFTENTNV